MGQLAQVMAKLLFQSAKVLPVIPAEPIKTQPVLPPAAYDCTVTLPVTLPPIVAIRAVTVGEDAIKVRLPALANVPKVGVNVPIKFSGFPKVNVIPDLLSVISCNEFVKEFVCVINIELVIAAVPPMFKTEVDEPVKLPLVTAVGKVIAPFNVNAFPFKLKRALICVKAPEIVIGVPNTNVCAALLFNVKLFKVWDPEVKNKGLVIPVPEIIKLDVVEPVKLPLVREVGKICVPFNASVCPFKLTTPLVCVNAAATVVAPTKVFVKLFVTVRFA